MSGPRRCYLHVGLPKTGTSYLQSILWRSPAALADQDLQMLPHSEPATFEMMLALRGQLDPAMDPPAAFEAFDRFREEASRATCTRALVSQELLGAAKPAQIATLLEALDQYEVHVIVTVRDLAGFAPSAWQQHVKARGLKTLHEYLEDLAGMGSGKPAPSYDVHGVLDRWGAQVPPERMHVVTVPKRGTSERVLLERFCNVLDVDPDALNTRAPSANTSLRRSSGSPRHCSGDMYASLPLMTPTWVRTSRSLHLAIPKSMSLGTPSYESKMFCGETSRCTMPRGRPLMSHCRCAASRPQQTSCTM